MPDFRPKRPVPYASAEIIDEELRRLEKLGVIEKTGYSLWVASTVCLKKKKSAQIIQPDLMIV